MFGSSDVQPASSTLRATLRTALAYVALALAVTWPLALVLGSHLPLGELHEATVPQFNLWTLEWNAQRMAHGYVGYWDAPIFYPAHDTFAMSEPMALQGLLFTPLSWMFGPIAAYNLALLCILVANAFAARRLLGMLGASRLAADLTGALVLGMPFVMKELGVFQLTLIAPLLCVLAELCVLSRAPTRAAFFRLALACVATLYACVYYALFLALFLILALPFVLRRTWFMRPLMLPLIASLVLGFAAVSPLIAVQRRALSRNERSASELRYGSAGVSTYLHASSRSLVARAVPALAAKGQSRSLYPGLVLCLLALFGLVQLARARKLDRFLRLCLVAIPLTLWLSYGTRLHIAELRPYALLQHHFPGFAQLRSPYRFAVLTQILIVLFAGLGLHAIGSVRMRHASWCVPLMAALALIEALPLGLPVQRFPSESMRESWVEWLRVHPGGAIANVPPAASGKARDYEPTTLAMLQSLRHGHPLLDGYSGFFPKAADHAVALARRFPRSGTADALRSAGARYVVVDQLWLAQHDPQRLSDKWWRTAQLVFGSGNTRVYELSR